MSLKKTMKYRLNYNWNGYFAGDEFSTYDDGSLKPPKGALTPWPIIVPETLELLSMSGALTPIEEEGIKVVPVEGHYAGGDSKDTFSKKKCQCNEKPDGQIININKKGECVVCGKNHYLFSYKVEEKVELPNEMMVFDSMNPDITRIIKTQNAILKYIKAHEK